MSYLSWRKENDNEKRYMEIVNNGALETFPAFKDSAFIPELQPIVSQVMKELNEDPNISLIAFSCVFAEYLYETYGVVPIDCEIFTQVSMSLFFDYMNKTIEMTTKKAVETMLDIKIPDDTEEDNHDNQESN